MNEPDYYYSGSEDNERWQCDCPQECCSESWADLVDFKYGDNPSNGTKITIFRGESVPYKIEEIYGKFGFSERLVERLYDLLGEDGSEHTEVPDDIDDSFLKWLSGQIEINWFRIINIKAVPYTYNKFNDTWLEDEPAIVKENK